MCDTRIAARVTGKVYKMVVRTAMVYGLERIALTKQNKITGGKTGLSLGETRMNRIKNDYIRGTAQVEHVGDKATVRQGCDFLDMCR